MSKAAENHSNQHQINIAEIQRNAGRDYHEYHIQVIQSPKVLMMALPECELDVLSINNEQNFKFRFGRNLNLESRKSIIEFKHRYRWTDKNIRQLLVTGGIQINHNNQTVTIYREPYSYFAAWLLMGLASIYYFGFILILANLPQSLKVFMAQFITASICVATLWLFHWVFIYPYNLLVNVEKTEK